MSAGSLPALLVTTAQPKDTTSSPERRTMHTSDEDLGRYVLEALPFHAAAAVTLHLRACAACQTRLVESVRAPGGLFALANPDQPSLRAGKEDRHFARIPTDQVASIRILDPASSARCNGRVLNTSP